MLGPRLLPLRGRTDDRLVEGWWSRPAAPGDTVIPDGAVDLLWAPGRVPWVAGPDTAPRPVELRPGEVATGVRLRPGAAAAAVRGSLELLTGAQVPLDGFMNGAAIRRLSERLDEAPSPAGAASLLAVEFCAHIDGRWEPDPIVVRTVDCLRDGAPLPEVGLSARQLRRRFASAMGYGPKFFERVCRLDRFTRLLAPDEERPLAHLAAEVGYFDQAHLARDCVALTGRTPSQLRADP
jgi:AraC-like DNA-binding protein